MKINMNEKTLKIVMVAGGFVVGAGTGSGLTLLIMKKKKGPMFHGMTYDQLKYEHNKKRAERKARKQAEKEAKKDEPVTEIVNDGSIVSKAEHEPVKKPEGKVEETHVDIPPLDSNTNDQLINVIKDEPHWLNEEMFYSRDNKYEKVTLEYYMDDDTFALNDEQVLDILEFNGEQIANFFHAVNVSTIQYPEVFVRNDILKRDYAIHFNWDSYSSAVLGIDPEEEAEPRADDYYSYGDDDDDYYSYDNDDDDEDDEDEEEEDDEFDPLMDDTDEPGGDE